MTERHTVRPLLRAPVDTDPKTPTVKCPICGTLITRDSQHHPFCSSRCRQIDLGRWLSGDYVISRPIEQSDLDEE